MSELAIWFFVPVILSGVIWVVLKKKKWFSFIKITAVGVTLGIAGLVFAPTTLCTSLCDKVLIASVVSVCLNSILLSFAILWFRSRKQGESV